MGQPPGYPKKCILCDGLIVVSENTGQELGHTDNCLLNPFK